jgi:NADPH:quinone reductase-like Zn-dependent oxidoreductase
MTTPAHRWPSLVLVIVAGCSAATSRGAERPVSPDTTRLLAQAITTRAGASAQDRQAARALIREGDHAYRRHRYAQARRAYENAYANRPDAYAYVMTGDAHWREVLQASAPPGSVVTCRLESRQWAHDLDTDVAQHHELGLALAQRDGSKRLIESHWYRQADQTASCLRRLAASEQAQAPGHCADLKALQTCLGSPLIR